MMVLQIQVEGLGFHLPLHKALPEWLTFASSAPLPIGLPKPRKLGKE